MAAKRRQKSRKQLSSEARKRGESRVPIPDATPSGLKISVQGKNVIAEIERVFLLKSEVIDIFGAWPKVVDRMLHATRNGLPWLEIVSNRSGASGAEVRVTAKSVCEAVERLRGGEVPPLMPSEKKIANSLSLKKAPGKISDKALSALLRAGDLLPSGLSSATFNQQLKIVTLQWSNGNYQLIRKVTRRGRNTRMILVCFDCRPGKPSPIRPSMEGEEDL